MNLEIIDSAQVALKSYSHWNLRKNKVRDRATADSEGREARTGNIVLNVELRQGNNEPSDELRFGN